MYFDRFRSSKSRGSSRKSVRCKGNGFPRSRPWQRPLLIETLEQRSLLAGVDGLVYVGIGHAPIDRWDLTGSPNNAGLLLVDNLVSGSVAPLHSPLTTGNTLDPFPKGVGFSGLTFLPDGTLVGSTSGGTGTTSDFLRISPTTGEVLARMPVRVGSTPINIGDLGVNPVDGRLYGIRSGDGGGGVALFVIDPSNGAATLATSQGFVGTLSRADGLAFANDGTPFVSGTDSLTGMPRLLNAQTGQSVAVASLVLGMSFDGNGQLIGTISGQDEPVLINRNTGAFATITLADVPRGVGGDLAFPVSTNVRATQVVFQTDFENGDGGFTADNTGAPFPGLWHYSVGRYADGQMAHSPIHNWYYGLHESSVGAGTYVLSNRHQGVLKSPSIALPSCGTLIGSFSYLLSVRPELDRDFVDVSVEYVDEANQKQVVKVLSRADGTLPQTDHRWATGTIDLTQFAGKNIRLLFSFDTGDIVPYDPEGWYIDDVMITSVPSDACMTADLNVTKNDGVSTVTPGDGQTRNYEITVMNAGPSDATSVTVTDTWPVGFDQGLLPANCTVIGVGPNFTCDLGTIAVSGLKTILIPYTVPAGTAAGAYTNTVTVTSANLDPTPATASDTNNVLPLADLTVTKSDGLTSVVAGDAATHFFTITVSNAGPSDATGVAVNDIWPSGYLLGALPPGCTLVGTGPNFTCTLGTIPASTSRNFQIPYTVPAATAAGTQTNSVTVTSTTPDATPATASDTNTIVTSADINVTKSDGVTNVAAGDGLVRTFTISVSNIGPSDATSVVLTDTWPSGYLLGTLPKECTLIGAGPNFTCALGSVTAGSNRSVQITYTVPAATPPGPQTNIVTVTSATPDPTPATASDTNIVESTAALTLAKSDGSSTVTAGDGITRTFTITVSNAGPADATGVVLTDTWPAGYLLGTLPVGCSLVATGPNFTCALGTITAGSNKQINVNYTVPSSTPPGIQTNTVTATTTSPNSNPPPASDTNTVITSADLHITKDDGVTNVTAGDGATHTFTIMVVNSGPSDAANVVVTDNWPSGYILGTPPAGCALISGGPNFSCNLGVIPAGTNKSIQVPYTVPASTLSGPQTNTVTANSTTPDPTPASATDINNVVTPADLNVTKTDGVTAVVAGDGVNRTFTITVSNAGPAIATGVRITDTWPTGYALGTLPAGCSLIGAGPNFSCDLGTIAVGGNKSVQVPYTVPASTHAGPQTNSVAVTSTTADPTPATASDTNTVTTTADLNITKSDGVTTVTAGDGVTRTFTITVSNAGPSNATNVVVNDIWPSGYTLGTLPAGCSLVGAGPNFTCDLGTITSSANKSVQIPYTVPASTLPGLQTNTVTAASATPDPTPNSATDINTVATAADLNVAKSDGVITVTAGDGVTRTFTITVSNAGPSNAANVVVTDTWPGGYTLGTLPASCSLVGSGPNFTCTLGAITAGGNKSIQIPYTVPASTSPGQQTNTVSVTSTTPDATPPSANDANTVVTSADLNVTKTDGVTNVTAGDGVVHVFTITVSNAGPSDAANVVVTDTWPLGYMLGTLPSGCALIGSGPNFTCTLGVIAANTSKNIQVPYTVPASTPAGLQQNKVDVTSTTPDPTLPSATDTNTVTPSVAQVVQFISPLSVYRANGPLPGPAAAPVTVSPPNAGKGTIKGYKWNDLDQDGVWDANEPGRRLWRIFLDLDNDGTFDPDTEPRAVTGTDGSYIFANIDPGTYTIREDNGLLSDGTFVIQKFPSANQFTVTLAAGQTIEGDFGVAETPNFGGFDYSPFIRPADDFLGHLKIADATERQALVTALTPWQLFNISNSTSAAFNVTSIDTSSIASATLRSLVKVVDSNFNPISFPLPVAAGTTVTLFAFFDPALRNAAGDTVTEQFPDWFSAKKATNGALTFAADDNIKIVTDTGPTFRVNLVGASTFDSDIFSDGSVDAVDSVQFSRLLGSVPLRPTNGTADIPWDPTSDMNARCPNGAEGAIGTCSWALTGSPSREIWLGDFAPLNVETGRTRAPFLDLDADNSSGSRGVNFSTTFVNTPVKIADTDARFANTGNRVLASLTAKISNPVTGDQLNLTAGALFTVTGNGTSQLTVTGNATIEEYLAVLKNITYSHTGTTVTARTVEIQISTIGNSAFSPAGLPDEKNGNTAIVRIQVQAGGGAPEGESRTSMPLASLFVPRSDVPLSGISHVTYLVATQAASVVVTNAEIKDQACTPPRNSERLIFPTAQRTINPDAGGEGPDESVIAFKFLPTIVGTGQNASENATVGSPHEATDVTLPATHFPATHVGVQSAIAENAGAAALCRESRATLFVDAGVRGMNIFFDDETESPGDPTLLKPRSIAIDTENEGQSARRQSTKLDPWNEELDQFFTALDDDDSQISDLH